MTVQDLDCLQDPLGPGHRRLGADRGECRWGNVFVANRGTELSGGGISKPRSQDFEAIHLESQRGPARGSLLSFLRLAGYPLILSGLDGIE